MRVIEVKLWGQWIALTDSDRPTELSNGYLIVESMGPLETVLNTRSYRPVEWRILED